MLSSLRPSEPTDLTELSVFLRQTKRQAALPASLPEPFLLSVARDLRNFEKEQERDEAFSEDSNHLAAPLMLVFSLMLSASRRKQTSEELLINESNVLASLRVYQWAVEREIVTRITGINGENDEHILLDALRAAPEH
ncbi:hypothetical protein [uncultured Ramlibacter sp.]|uniref:hypothetical protein n=1 Tax=uncultured Ramlibacter sp. TaxID=260755 RepID=UPI00261A2378|nr:hypothetical protein [uncultured Ramlibacter sp.]